MNFRHRQLSGIKNKSLPATPYNKSFEQVRKPRLPQNSSPAIHGIDQQPNGIHSDTIHSYCTEDTPAVLSHAGSNSDLSNLLLDSEPKSTTKQERGFSSDESSNTSGENENILAECIQSAMPKARSVCQPKNVTTL